MTTTTTKITLSDRAPVRIDKDTWPLIAQSYWGDGYSRGNPDERWEYLRVRQHGDGRTLVYGCKDGEFDRTVKGGELLEPGDDIPAAIHRVAERCELLPYLADECIGTLPAKEI